MIADALREAEDMYPEEWIEDAIDEAVKQNKRSWRYVSAILEAMGAGWVAGAVLIGWRTTGSASRDTKVAVLWKT